MAVKKKVPAVIEEMDKQYCVVMVNGKVKILSWQPSDVNIGMVEPVFSDESDLNKWFRNKFVSYRLPPLEEGGEERVKREPAFEYWMKRNDRPQAAGLCVENTTERFVNGLLNLWGGFAVRAKPGKHDLILKHIYEVLCPESREHGDYFVRWLAWRIQHPTEVPGVAIVFRGRKGTGKGTMAVAVLMRIFGSHAYHISDRKALTGAFNAHLMRCCLLIADEAFWPGDKTGEGALKRIITEPTLDIEPKGVNRFQAKNHIAIIFLSNEDWIVPATSDERRFAVFDVSDIHMQDAVYFTALMNQINGGGVESFLHFLQNMDIGDWKPNVGIPKTDALFDQMAESANSMDNWMADILANGSLPAKVIDPDTRELVRVVHPVDPGVALNWGLLEHAKVRKGNSYVTRRHLEEYLKEHGIFPEESLRRSNKRYWRFPPLPKARAIFKQKHPWARFDHMDENWVMPVGAVVDAWPDENDQSHEPAASEQADF